MSEIDWLGKFFYAAGTLVSVPVIAYGILRTQLFDIDLRVRWTIKQSTVAAVFVAVFYLVSEGVDRFLSSELGNLFGLFASALVVFFLAPLQRVGLLPHPRLEFTTCYFCILPGVIQSCPQFVQPPRLFS